MSQNRDHVATDLTTTNHGQLHGAVIFLLREPLDFRPGVVNALVMNKVLSDPDQPTGDGSLDNHVTFHDSPNLRDSALAGTK